MFQIKICGVTTVADALDAVAAGADAIGLNFAARSPRCITIEQARLIAASLPAQVVKVGVFVDTIKATVLEIAEAVGLNMIQLHGDEGPERVNELAPHSVVRALRCGTAGIAPTVQFLSECRVAGRLPDAVLLDAAVGQQFGGTGAIADWQVARAYAQLRDVPPLILAGGLTSENVAAAIAAVGPAAVDTASGVESSPGRKDPAKLRAFVQAAREAFTQLALAR